MLIACLRSPIKVDRLGAIEALSRTGFEDARPVLCSCLRLERDPEVRQALEDVLRVNGQ